MSDENNSDDDEKQPKSFEEMMSKLFGMMAGGDIESMMHGSLIDSFSPEDKAEYERIDKIMDARVEEMSRAAFHNGCVAFGVGRAPILVETFGADSVYDGHTCMVHAVEKDVCFQSNLRKMDFAPDSDEEIYTEEQLKPDGVASSLVARMFVVYKKMPDSFAGAFGKPEKKEKPELSDHLCDSFLLEVAKVISKKRVEGQERWQYNIELVARKEFDTEFLMSEERITFPALPVDLTSNIDFISTLEFSDENPESGG